MAFKSTGYIEMNSYLTCHMDITILWLQHDKNHECWRTLSPVTWFTKVCILPTKTCMNIYTEKTFWKPLIWEISKNPINNCHKFLLQTSHGNYLNKSIQKELMYILLKLKYISKVDKWDHFHTMWKLTRTGVSHPSIPQVDSPTLSKK